MNENDEPAIHAVPAAESGGATPARPRETPKLLRVEEVAELLLTSPKAIYSMAERGNVPGVFRIGRRLLFRRDVLMRWLEGDLSSPQGAIAMRRGRRAA